MGDVDGIVDGWRVWGMGVYGDVYTGEVDMGRLCMGEGYVAMWMCLGDVGMRDMRRGDCGYCEMCDVMILGYGGYV